MLARKKYGKWLVISALCSVLFSPCIPHVKAGDSEDKNYLTNEEYKKFGMQLENPLQFSDENNDPLMDYKPTYVNELFISASNNDDAKESEIKNGYFFQENAMSEKELTNVLKKETTIPKRSGDNLKASGQEWQMTNSVAANIDGNEQGRQDIVQMACMYDKELKRGIVRLYLHQEAGVKQLNTGTADLMSTESESYVLDYTLDETAGYTAMAAGDYDGDGKDEVAYYVAATQSPYIRIVNIEANGAISTLGVIYLSQLTPDRRFGYDGHKEKTRYMPVVSLATTTISGQADLVVNVSLPLLDKGFIKDKVQTSVAAFYSYKSGGMKAASILELQYPDKRIRFASATEGNILGDDNKELIIGGYINQGYNSGDVLGKLNTDNNAIQVIMWSKEKGYYPYFAEPKMVAAASGKGLRVNDRSNMPALEPACLAAANLTGGSKDYLFLEGKILSYNEKEATFSSQGTLGLKGDNKAFIKTAAAGTFSAGNAKKQQIYIISGDHYSGNTDQIYLDISVVYTTDLGEVKADVFRNDFYDKQNEDDNSTWLNFCTVNADEDTTYVKYKGKAAGWSRPELYAVLQSPPYWKELDYSNQIYGAGSAAYTIGYGRSSGTEGTLGVGLGMTMSLRVSGGTGFFGTHVTVGGGLDIDELAQYVGAWTTTNEVNDSIGITVPPGDDYAVLFAVPVVTYSYDVYLPTYTVTQSHIDYYKDNQVEGGSSYDYKVGDIVEGHMEEMKMVTELEPSFSSMSVDKYNTLVKSMEGMKEITSDQLPDKENGDPTTYPKTDQALKDIKDAKNVRLSKYAATTGGDEAARTLTVSYEKSKGESHGFNLALDVGVVGTGEMAVDFIVTGKGSIEGGPKGHLEGGCSFVESTASGNEFQVVFADYPSDAGDNYSFSTKLGIYNAGQLLPEKGKGDGPYMLSYVVTGANENEVPPMPPVNLKVYNTSTHEIVLNWENSDYRAAGSYEIFRENSQGSFVSIGKVDGSETFYVDQGLEADTVYRYKIVAYAQKEQQGVKSAMSKPTQGKTKSLLENGPSITQQPDSVGAAVGSAEKPSFTVAAKPGNQNNSLTYQWQKYEVASDSSIGTFADIEGAHDVIYRPPLLTGTTYRVQVTESNGKAVNSRAVTLYVNDEHLSYFQTQTKLSAMGEDGSGLLRIGNEYYVKEGDIPKFTVNVTSLGENAGVPVGNVVFGVKNEDGSLQKLGPVPLDEAGNCEIAAPLGKGTYQVEAWYLGNLEDSQMTNKYLTSNTEVMKVSFGQPDSEEEYYFIEYQMDGGQENNQNPKVYTKDSGTITLVPPVDKPGAVFDGWYLDEDKTNKIEVVDSSLEEMQKDLVIYAKWQEVVYPIIYELKEGINAPENPASYTVSTPDIKLKDPTLAGQQFEGWYQEAECITKMNVIPKGSTEEKNVYAKWRPDSPPLPPPGPLPDEGEKSYQIYSMEDLYEMASKVNAGDSDYVDASYRLMNNIDGKGTVWSTTIGTAENPFNGIMEGDNYTIHNVNMSGMEQALFHTIGEKGQVKNLRVYTFIGDGTAINAAGLAIYNKGSINQCHSGMNVDSSIYVDENGQVTLEAFNSKIIASETAGGIVAWNEGSIINSVSSSIVIGETAGGIVGINTGKLQNGYNTGRINGNSQAGGIAGSNRAEGTLFNLYSCGNISGQYTGSITGTSDNKEIKKCYYNTSGSEPCSSQNDLDATYIRTPDMKTKAFAKTLNANAEDWFELSQWYQENERNAGYPRLYNQGMSKAVLYSDEFGITVSGYGLHRNTRLSVQKLEPDSAIYQQFKAHSPEDDILNVFDITLIDENGSKMDYDSPVLLQFPLGFGEKLGQIQILHRQDEATIQRLKKPDDFEVNRTLSTNSLSAFAVVRSKQIVTGEEEDPPQTPPQELPQNTPQKPAVNLKQEQPGAAVKTGDSLAVAGTVRRMLVALGIGLLLIIYERKKR